MYVFSRQLKFFRLDIGILSMCAGTFSVVEQLSAWILVNYYDTGEARLT